MQSRRTLRLPAISLAALALFGQLAGFAHLVAVDHVRCEHGELVDVAHHAPAVASHHDPDESFHAASAAETREHEHCLLSPMRRDHATVAPRPSQSSIVACNRHSALATPGSTVPAPIPLILLAPKSSPPTV
jgi:hypothetical protein